MIQEIFVGREVLIKRAKDHLSLKPDSEDGGKPKALLLQGPGGIGKTKLLARLREDLSNEGGFDCTTVVDLKTTAHRSALALLQTLATSLAISDVAYVENEPFAPFLDAIQRYNGSRDQEKYALYNSVMQLFVECCRNKSRTKPVAIFFDTFETVKDIDLGNWILSLVSKLGGKVAVVIAGRERIVLNPSEVHVLVLPVEGLSRPEIDVLARKMFESRNILHDYDFDDAIIDRITDLTDGRPILVALSIEWILEDVDIEALLSIKKSDFEARLVNGLRYLKHDEDLIVLMMATIDRRLNPRIVEMLTGWTRDKCEDICKILTRFTFVKVIDSGHGSEKIYTLHDEMLRLVSQHVDFPIETKNRWRKCVVDKFYDDTIQQLSDPQAMQIMVAEKLYYQLRYSSQEAIEFFDEQMRSAVAGYDFDFADLLLSEAQNTETALDKRQENVVRLNYAEMLAKRYQPFEAKKIFDDLVLSFSPETETSFFSRANSGLGACIANGSTVVEANYNEAIALLKAGLDVCREKGLHDRVATILYELGYCFDILGQNDETLRYYSESNEMAFEIGNMRLATATLDEMGKLRLRRYEVSEALDLFSRSLDIKEKMGDNKGKGASYHYIGNAYRDLDDFPEALKWYSLAETARSQVADDLGLCELYSDVAWLYFLDSDFVKALEFQDKCYYGYALPRHFGREIADAEHSYYHIKLELEGLDAALPWIEKSFKNAEIYSNTFILLDAAMHLIEAAYEKRNFEMMPYYYERMEELDRKGCGYRMFKGRATVVLGDAAYDDGDFDDAIEKWQYGYSIIAIHGRSRSSVLSFCDYFHARHVKLNHALYVCGKDRAERLLNYWSCTPLEGGSTTLMDEYPILGGVCKCVLGDIYYDEQDFENALENWIDGLVAIVQQIMTKPRSEAVRLGSYLEVRKHKMASLSGFGLEVAVKDYIKRVSNAPWCDVELRDSPVLASHFVDITAAFFGQVDE